MTTPTQFPPPPSLPRQYAPTTHDGREDVPDEWMQYGACNSADPDAFFPEKGGNARDAKKVCAGCDVRAQCLQYALEHEEKHGLWGGLTERERRKLRGPREIGHGTNAMYTRGCHNPDMAPPNYKATCRTPPHPNYQTRLDHINRAGAA
jgi:WhiB family redox-sensing transcriptional regulator